MVDYKGVEVTGSRGTRALTPLTPCDLDSLPSRARSDLCRRRFLGRPPLRRALDRQFRLRVAQAGAERFHEIDDLGARLLRRAGGDLLAVVDLLLDQAADALGHLIAIVLG